MSIEWYNENHKKKEKKLDMQKVEAFKEKKRLIESIEKTEKKLSELKQAFEKWNISSEQIIAEAQNIITELNIKPEQIEEILEKIDEIENTENVDKYLPQELRITKTEYNTALTNHEERKKTIKKISKALVIISNKLEPNMVSGVSLLTDLMILDKNLVKLQENHIDIKKSLRKKNWKKESFWEWLKEIIKL